MYPQVYNICDEGANPATGRRAFNGALNSVVTFRRNTLSLGQGIAVHGTTSDAVVEANFVHLGAGSFMKDPVQVDAAHTDHILLRANGHDA